MLVIIIIGVLAATVMPRLAGRSQQARIAAAQTDIKANIALALDLFEMDVGRYPTTEEGLGSLLADPGTIDNWKGPYLKKDAKDPWSRSYVYRYPGSQDNTDYELYSAGPNGVEGDDDDIAK
jgi:general secretion pathway protein G